VALVSQRNRQKIIRALACALAFANVVNECSTLLGLPESIAQGARHGRDTILV